MAVKPSVVEVTLESTLTNVEVAEELARRVSATAGVDEEDQHKIEMAVHESMINAVWHGNKNDSSKTVWLRCQIQNGRLEIRIRDQGNGFDPSRIPDPLAMENILKVSGRGIFLIRTFMDEFRVTHKPGLGTEVTMVKRVHSDREPEQGGTGREHESHSSTN